MATPFIAELRIFSFNFAPKGWAMCNGQLLPINQNQALFSLLGTTYGGNGVQNFGLPNLQGRAPLSAGNGGGLSPRTLGETAGEASHTLIVAEMPIHNHAMNAATVSGDKSLAGTLPSGKTLAEGLVSLSGTTTAPAQIYGTGGANRVMATTAIANAGANQPHNNMQPYLVLNICIALQGIFPSRN